MHDRFLSLFARLPLANFNVSLLFRSAILAAAGFLVAGPASAQITFDASASSSCTVCGTLSWSHTVGNGSNRLLVVGVAESNNPFPSATSVTYSGQNLTRQVLNGAANPISEIWTLVNPPSGTATIVVTHPATPNIVGGSVSFAGVDQNTSIRASNQARAINGVSASVSTNPADVVIDAVAVTSAGGGNTATAAGGQTTRWNQSGGSATGAGSTKSAGAGSTTMSWATSSVAPPALSALAVISLIPATDLGVTKSGPATVVAGNNISYNIGVSNLGPADAQNVTLSDTLPGGTTFVSLTAPAGWSCTTPAVGGTGTVNCSIATLANGATGAFTLVFQVNANAVNGSTITNTASVSSSTSDSNPGNNSANSSATVSTSADLAVTKSGPATIVAGNNITYNLSATNNGPSNAQSVALTDPLPAGTTFVSEVQNTGPAFSCTNPGVGASGTVSCAIATLAAGASATFTLVFNLAVGTPGGTTITNTATVSSTTSDPTPGNNSASASTTVSGGNVDLAITKTPSPPPYGTGLPVTYTITVSNAGPAPAAGVTATDVIPAGATFVSATPSQGSCSGTSTVTCSLGTLASGGSATISLVLTLPSTSGAVSNTATVTSPNPDTNPANNSSTATVNVISAASIPALSWWGLLLLGLTITVLGVIRLRV